MEQGDLLPDTAKQSQSQKKPRRKKGILGVPVGNQPILFNFTSKELWPDEKSDVDDVASDEDYQPEPRAITGIKKQKNKISSNEQNHNESKLADESSSITNNGEYEPMPLIEESASLSSSSDDEDGNFHINSKNKNKKTRKRVIKKKSVKPKAATKSTRVIKSNSGQTNGPAISSPNKKTKSPKKVKNTASGSHHSHSTSLLDFNSLLRPSKFDFYQIIPPEILVSIFSHVLDSEKEYAKTLIKLSHVCETWRRLIISTPKLWERLDLCGFPDDRFPLLNLKKMQEDNGLFVCVKQINLSGWSSVNAERLIQIVANSTNFDLELLNVKNCRNLSSKFLEIIMERFPNIKSLDISAVTTSSAQNCTNPFTNNTFRPFLNNCGSKLKELFMSENLMPSFPSVISNVMEFCYQLEVLDISNVASLGGRSTSVAIDKLQNSCPRIRILRAANINFTPTVCSAATPPMPGFPFLQELSIPFHESFMMTNSMLDGNTDWTIELLTKGAENLKLLDIRGSRYISHGSLLRIPTWSMKHLSMSNCTKLENESLKDVILKWNNSLVDIDLSWNKSEKCMNACANAIWNDRDGQKIESPLRSIQLRGSAISFESLRDLLLNCPLLNSIDLQSCRSLPRGIKRAYFGDDFKQLRSDLLQGKFD
ncbi:hypothetical protein RDWZM_003358 [Blomia tropicalis]|uniref:F-box domain-containing protein n=1 Tax=Blomia tropicalis TaxID=40697 RepID=A0A9Q0RQS6_BLOTA|nr:hypothetical protein RDWZM_003358 [Blomia tropicalis]